MNEIRFIHLNRKRWEEFENLVKKEANASPDRVSDLYIGLTNDLAYARTYYPGSNITQYLNFLAQKAHQIIYQNKPVKRGMIVNFWRYDFPLTIYSARKEILVSFLVFLIAALIGLLSNKYDPDFVRIILGDQYVDMTLANIEKGDPMAVYKQMNEVDMFLGISLNNIYVSFLAFVFGVFTALGSGFILLKNGIMLGTFQGFLAQHGYLNETLATVWIHGTLEIFAILVAGGAGIVMGNSFVFPGTFSRGKSFQKGARKGVKMIIGLIPVFLIAGFLEGFITRHTDFPYFIRFLIIGFSVLFILIYFVIYPYQLNLKYPDYGKRTDQL